MRFETAKYGDWLLRPLWSLEEGIQLLYGIEPVHNVTHALRHYKRDGLRQEIITRLDIGERSIKAGTLECENYYSAHWACELKPATFLKWVESNGWEIPGELVSILNSMEPEQSEPIEENLDKRERRTLLQIIAVLAKEADLDLTKHQAAAVVVQKMGATHRIELPTSQNTIANKLRDAQDLLKSQ